MPTPASISSMLPSGISSNRGHRRREIGRTAVRGWGWGALLSGLVALIGLLRPPAGEAAQLRLTQERALRVAFPEPATIERRTAFLDDSDLQRARQLAGSDVALDQRVITYYVGLNGPEPAGVAYFDAHRVRTLPEILMIVVSPAGRIARIEILRFSEPPEYRAPDSWIEQFRDQALSDGLSLKGSIVNITGATLTARAITEASRRILALHQLIKPLDTVSNRGYD